MTLPKGGVFHIRTQRKEDAIRHPLVLYSQQMCDQCDRRCDNDALPDTKCKSGGEAKQIIARSPLPPLGIPIYHQWNA